MTLGSPWAEKRACCLGAMTFAEYTPKRPKWVKIWKRLSDESRRKRFNAALDRKAAVDAASSESLDGRSERANVAALKPHTDRSNLRRWKQRYEQYGFDGLVSWSLPPASSHIPEAIRVAICTMRRADPNTAIDDIVKHIAEHHDFQTSGTTVKRVLRAAGLARRPGPATGTGKGPEKAVALGGMQLVCAALVETGYLEAMGQAVAAVMDSAPPSPQPLDNTDRDSQGRFLPSYNERLRKTEGDDIGPGFASVATKRDHKDLSRLHLASASVEVIKKKLLAVMASPLLGGGRWDGLRTARGELLGEICGFPYMPSTLDLFTRELKYLGVSSTLWEAHARLWLEQTGHWSEAKRCTVVYVDGTTKPIWTDLFSQSSKVSSVGRVMPALETVAFHSGYGVPLWMKTHSGRAPLVEVIPEMLDHLRQELGGSEIGRIVVIDAEGNSVPFLQALEEGAPARAWATRLKPSMLDGKHIFNRTNYQSYRNGDRVRCGLVDLNNAEIGPQASFRTRIAEVEHRTTGEVTYIGASTLLSERDWGACDLADLYFDRWPNQEANFRAVNQALGFKDVHGYGKQLVDNVTVVTELDKLEKKIHNTEARITGTKDELTNVSTVLKDGEKALKKMDRRASTVARQMKRSIDNGEHITPKIRRLVQEQQTIEEQTTKQAKQVARSTQQVEKLIERLERQQGALERQQARQEDLSSRRRIFQHDVELDSIFGALKVGLVLAITFVLKEYLGDAKMDPETFLNRIATLPARLLTMPRIEILTFEYNHRDPDAMALLEKYCESINARKLLTTSGRVLRMRVEPAPPPKRPPTGRRSKAGDRFAGN